MGQGGLLDPDQDKKELGYSIFFIGLNLPFVPVNKMPLVPMSPYGSFKLPMALYNFLWFTVGPNGSRWLLMAPDGSLWLAMASLLHLLLDTT